MKIFDFSNGQIGNQLGESRRPEFCAANPIRDGHFVDFREPMTSDSEWGLHVKAGWGWGDKEKLIAPEQYGVEAIAFCTGRVRNGDWIWNVVATEAWINRAYESGMFYQRSKAAEVAA